MCGWTHLGYETPEGVIFTEWGQIGIELGMWAGHLHQKDPEKFPKGSRFIINSIRPTTTAELIEKFNGDKKGPVSLSTYNSLVSDGNWLLREDGAWTEKHGWLKI